MTEELGAYVHIPFCRHRCDYCAFATTTDRDHLMAAYVVACRREVARAWAQEGLPPATSIYVGGGTPSRLDPGALCSIIETVPRAPSAEIIAALAAIADEATLVLLGRLARGRDDLREPVRAALAASDHPRAAIILERLAPPRSRGER